MKNDNTEDSRCQIIGKEEKQFIKVMFDQIMFWNTPNKFVKLPKCNLDPHLKLGKSFPWWELIFNVTRLTNSYWSQTIVQVVWTVAPILFSIILCNHPHYCNWEQNLTHWLDSVLIWTDFTCDLIYLSESTPDLQESDPLCPAVTDKAMTEWIDCCVFFTPQGTPKYYFPESWGKLFMEFFPSFAPSWLVNILAAPPSSTLVSFL